MSYSPSIVYLCPWILCDFSETLKFETYINVARESAANRNDFFNIGALGITTLHIHVIDGATNILRSVRCIEVDEMFMRRLKIICSEQAALYASAEEIDAAAPQSPRLCLEEKNRPMIFVPGIEV